MLGIVGTCAPFFERDAGSWLPQLRALRHEAITLRIITDGESARRAAWELLRTYPWKDYQLGIFPGWHAKIYLAHAFSRRRVCLIGSHNFSRGGAQRNFEAGTLLSSSREDSVADAITAVQSELTGALRRCTVVFDPVTRPHENV